ncbi:MAG: GPR endopeptidase [Lachnospiraceae bacterium]|jgi:spore protease|nr:GPR endopeptidase [Lachnospiraceae bacterium]
MSCFQVRTDLALEARESIGKAQEELRGITVEEYDREEIQVHITRVVISSKNGAKAMNKPMGNYITLEAPAMQEADEDYHREISEELAKQIQSILPGLGTEQSILVVGLGNRDVTADALGPGVVDNLFVTRHIVREYGKAAYNRERMNLVSGIVPGVMAATGMEAAEIVKGVVEQTSPDLIIVVDALAARSTKRLNRTIQVTDTGIQPGSGVGNHRNALTRENLGVPVIAVGVPTVVDAATIVVDAVDKIQRESAKEGHLLGTDSIRSMPELNNMYVTGKNIDEIIKRLSFTISEALNIALEL